MLEEKCGAPQRGTRIHISISIVTFEILTYCLRHRCHGFFFSGGIQRDWVGVPRLLYEVETGKTRCACVKQEMLDDPNLKVYPNCEKDADSCKTS